MAARLRIALLSGCWFLVWFAICFGLVIRNSIARDYSVFDYMLGLGIGALLVVVTRTWSDLVRLLISVTAIGLSAATMRATVATSGVLTFLGLALVYPAGTLCHALTQRRHLITKVIAATALACIGVIAVYSIFRQGYSSTPVAIPPWLDRVIGHGVQALLSIGTPAVVAAVIATVEPVRSASLQDQ